MIETQRSRYLQADAGRSFVELYRAEVISHFV